MRLPVYMPSGSEFSGPSPNFGHPNGTFPNFFSNPNGLQPNVGHLNGSLMNFGFPNIPVPNFVRPNAPLPNYANMATQNPQQLMGILQQNFQHGLNQTMLSLNTFAPQQIAQVPGFQQNSTQHQPIQYQGFQPLMQQGGHILAANPGANTNQSGVMANGQTNCNRTMCPADSSSVARPNFSTNNSAGQLINENHKNLRFSQRFPKNSQFNRSRGRAKYGSQQRSDARPTERHYSPAGHAKNSRQFNGKNRNGQAQPADSGSRRDNAGRKWERNRPNDHSRRSKGKHNRPQYKKRSGNEAPGSLHPLNNRKQTLLKKLFQSEIARDENRLLQVFRFMTTNSFFQQWPEKPLEFPSVTVKGVGFEYKIDIGNPDTALESNPAALADERFVSEIAEKLNSISEGEEEEGNEGSALQSEDEEEEPEEK